MLAKMTYLMRVVLPDRPGSLGAVATALGGAGGDIVSLDVVERGPDGAVDDVLVDLADGRLVDGLLAAALSVTGVSVESFRPYQGGQEIHRDLELVDRLAADPGAGVSLLADLAPGVFRAGWAVVVDAGAEAMAAAHSPAGSDGAGGGRGWRCQASSVGGPDLVGVELPWLPLASARRLARDENWVPARWRSAGMELAAAPLGDPATAVLVGRPGGPRFRASEVLRLAHLAGLTAAVLRLAPAPAAAR